MTKTISRPRTAPTPPPRRRPWLPYAVTIAVVVGAGLAAVVASRGSDHTPQATAFETAPVQVTGEPLPALPDGADGLVDPASDVAVGRPAPQLAGRSFDGSALTTGGTGRPTIVLFVAHWCPHCQREVPQLQSWRSQGLLSTDVDWFTVSTDVQPNGPNYPPSAWLARVGWTAPVMADSSDTAAARADGLTSFPYFVAVKADGTVAARATGELTLDQVRQLLAAATR